MTIKTFIFKQHLDTTVSRTNKMFGMSIFRNPEILYIDSVTKSYTPVQCTNIDRVNFINPGEHLVSFGIINFKRFFSMDNIKYYTFITFPEDEQKVLKFLIYNAKDIHVVNFDGHKVIFGKMKSEPKEDKMKAADYAIANINALEISDLIIWLDRIEPKKWEYTSTHFDDFDVEQIGKLNLKNNDVCDKIKREKMMVAANPLTIDIAIKCATSGIANGILKDKNGSRVFARICPITLVIEGDEVEDGHKTINTTIEMVVPGFTAITENGDIIRSSF